MIVVQNHIPVNPKYSEEFEKRFENTNNNLKQMKGFVKNQILRPIEADTYVVMTYWETLEDFHAWAESEEFKKAHSVKNPSDMFTGRPHLSVHQVVEQ